MVASAAAQLALTAKTYVAPAHGAPRCDRRAVVAGRPVGHVDGRAEPGDVAADRRDRLVRPRTQEAGQKPSPCAPPAIAIHDSARTVAGVTVVGPGHFHVSASIHWNVGLSPASLTSCRCAWKTSSRRFALAPLLERIESNPTTSAFAISAGYMPRPHGSGAAPQ